MRKIRSRLILIGIMIAFAVWELIPTNTTIRVRDPNGTMRDSTIRRLPINLGLDLQGGIHLALEVDQSKGPVPDPAEAIRRAERVVRTRIDEFGVTEPVVQVVGGNRLIVELAGEKDPSRAKSIIQRTAFLEFRITDMKNLFRDAIPAMDQALRSAGVKAPGTAGVPNAVSQLFGGDTAKGKAKTQAKAKGKANPVETQPDTSLLNNQPGALSSLLYQGQRLDREEFYRRIEQWIAQGKNPRGIERLEGVVYMPASIRVEQHSEPQAYIIAWLGTYAASTPPVQVGGNATSKLDPDNDPEADALLRIRPEYGGSSGTDRRGYIVGSPELLTEVTGATRQRDLETKFEIYRRNGVREYIVWETLADELYWFMLDDGEYVRQEPGEDGLIKSGVFPGLWLHAESLLNGDLARVLQVVQQGIASAEHAAFVTRLQKSRRVAE